MLTPLLWASCYNKTIVNYGESNANPNRPHCLSLKLPDQSTWEVDNILDRAYSGSLIRVKSDSDSYIWRLGGIKGPQTDRMTYNYTREIIEKTCSVF